MSDETISEESKILIDRICKKEAFANYETIVTDGSRKGDGYLSKLFRITIKGVGENGDTKYLHLILKTTHKSENYRKSWNCEIVFVRECFMYENVLLEFKKLQGELGIPLCDQFNNYCTYYGSSMKYLNEVIAMENLRECGYEHWDRKYPMPYDMVKMVIKTIGKYHALSFAMRDKKPELFQQLADSTPDLFYSIMKQYNFTSSITKNLQEAKKSLDPNTDFAVLERFSKFCENSWEVCERTIAQASGGSYSVITHGDLWCSNIIFQFQKPGIATEIRLLDWQFSRFASPVLDVSYFLLPNLRNVSHRMDELLHEYYKSVSTFLCQLGCEPDTLFPYRVFQSHWKQFSVLGLVMSSIIVKIMLVDEEDVPDYGKLADEGKDLNEGISNLSGVDKEYHGIMKEIIYYCVTNNFI